MSNTPIYEITFNGYEFKNVNKMTIDIEHNTTSPGAYLYSEDIITIEGVLLPTGCSANTMLLEASGMAKKLNYVDNSRTKEFRLNTIDDGYVLYDDVDANVKSFDFSLPENNKKFDRINYTVQLSIINYITGYNDLIKHESTEANRPIVSSATDNYTLEISDEKFVSITGEIIPLMKLTRNIGAVGLENGGKPAIWKARKWIENRQEKSSITGISQLKNWSFYNHQRNTDENLNQGSYNIQDTFLVSPISIPFNAIHSYTIDISQNPSEDLQIVNVKGKVQGLEQANTGDFIYKNFLNNTNTSYYNDHTKPTVSGLQNNSRQTNAYNNAYSLYTGLAFTGIFWIAKQAKTDYIDDYLYYVSDDPLQYMPVSITEGFNIKTASISYDYTYNNRSGPLLLGALVENFSVSNSSGIPSKVFRHNIIGRPMGPLTVWNTGQSGVSTKTISYEAVLPPYTGLIGYSYSQKIKDEAFNIVSGPIYSMLGRSSDQPIQKGYIESYDVNHNLGANTINATLKFVYNERCY